jgi:hypothetical protein
VAVPLPPDEIPVDALRCPTFAAAAAAARPDPATQGE